MKGEKINDRIKPKIAANTLTINISAKIKMETFFLFIPKIKYIFVSFFCDMKKLFT